MDFKLVYTTLPSDAVAEEIARRLVESRLAACGNILPAHIAVYEWAGDVQRASEVILLLKTTAAAAPALVEALRAAHPYEVPAILVLPVETVDAAFAAWVVQQTTALPS